MLICNDLNEETIKYYIILLLIYLNNDRYMQ